MSFRNVKIMCVTAIMALGVGCGPKSAEDTEKDWNKTKEDAQKYASKYPAAKPVLDDLMKTSQADFDAAKKADDKTKADKMGVAVDKLRSPLGVFKSYEDEWKNLDTLQHDKDLMAMSAADFKPLDDAATAAKKQACCILQPSDKACSDLTGTCAPGPAPANMGDLKGKLEPAIAAMQAADKALAAKKPKPAAPAAPAAGSGSAKK
jgi:hypothetical protein